MCFRRMILTHTHTHTHHGIHLFRCRPCRPFTHKTDAGRQHTQKCCFTQRQLLATVRGQGKTQHGHRSDQYTGQDQVAEIVQGASSNHYFERYVDVRFGAANVMNDIPFAGTTLQGEENNIPFIRPKEISIRCSITTKIYIFFL